MLSAIVPTPNSARAGPARRTCAARFVSFYTLALKNRRKSDSAPPRLFGGWRANPEAGQDRRAVGDIRHDLGDQLRPGHAAAPHYLLQRVGERRVRLRAAKEIGDLGQRAKRLLA